MDTSFSVNGGFHLSEDLARRVHRAVSEISEKGVFSEMLRMDEQALINSGPDDLTPNLRAAFEDEGFRFPAF